MAIPTLAAIFLQINALVVATMIVCLIVHEATAIWDLSYAYQKRVVTCTVPEILPLMANFSPCLDLARNLPNLRCDSRIHRCHGFTSRSSLLLFGDLPYAEELIRGLRR